MPKIVAYFDGACEPVNPGGTASYGALAFCDKVRIWECSEIYHPDIPNMTSNNIAEYLGFISVLKFLEEQFLDEANVAILGDSKLVIEQMSRRWRIRDGLYVPFAQTALDLLDTLKHKPRLHWIPRERNTLADALSKAHLAKMGIEPKVWNKR